jgi:hypothetical protein
VIGVPYYVYAVVTEDFFTGAPYNLNDTINGPEPITSSILNQVIQDMQQNASRSWTRLEPSSCIEIYSNDLLTNRAHVVAVSSIANATSSILTYGEAYIAVDTYPSLWVCEDYHPNTQCDVKSVRASTWTVSELPVQYCLSLPVSEQCELQFSVQLMSAVLVCNAVKLLVILYVAFHMTSFTSEALCTMGDALQSFLLRNDVYTKDLCLAGDRDFPESWWIGRTLPFLVSTRKRWYISASGHLWATVIIR